MDQYTFDEFDAGILSERQKARFRLSGPQIGDYVERADGMKARFTHEWNDGLQTTSWSKDGAKDHGGFYLNNNGSMSYSGSLEPSIPKTHLRLKDGLSRASFWFFHHGETGAHRGVSSDMFVRTYELIDDTQAINREIEGRFIIVKDKEKFKGYAQTSTYTTYDGVERVAYNNNMTLEEYLKDKEWLEVVTSAEMDRRLNEYHSGMITKPKEVTKAHYWDMLECLPPCRFDGNVFHVSERLTGNLVNWYFKKGKKHYGFVDNADITDERLKEIIESV